MWMFSGKAPRGWMRVLQGSVAQARFAGVAKPALGDAPHGEAGRAGVC